MGKKVKGQKFKEFIDPTEISQVLITCLNLDKNMVIDEIRLNRMYMS
jgi:hypothetical protein